jgi:fructokinase
MITVAGEALMDMLVGDAGEISAHPGGGPFNVARAVARLGRPCQFLGRVSDDAFGRRLRAALQEAGVTLAVLGATTAPTTLALAEVDSDGVADYRFYLEGTSAGQLATADVPAGVFASSSAIVLGGLGLLAEPMASTLATLLPDAAPATTVLLDPNCRPHAIADLTAFRATVEGFLAQTDVVKVSVDDLRLLDPGADVRAAARRLLDSHPAAVLVTDGAGPVTVHTEGGERRVRVPSVEVVDTVGAGDAFVAGFLTWWCDQGCDRAQAGDLDLLTEAARAAVTVAAATCSTAGANLPEEFAWPPPAVAGAPSP